MFMETSVPNSLDTKKKTNLAKKKVNRCFLITELRLKGSKTQNPKDCRHNVRMLTDTQLAPRSRKRLLMRSTSLRSLSRPALERLTPAVGIFRASRPLYLIARGAAVDLLSSDCIYRLSWALSSTLGAVLLRGNAVDGVMTILFIHDWNGMKPIFE